ncbi:hypothetical protein DPEC_G00163730 [Dallia pectoralis]|uniref:Uncharacterized protein n=1 Tax=Dallia pectoralis TaxID=75939 RepID=A0ACC2GH04_DALPE|nr:hypothetical protein DPEC_G00163730 [Dallia pectoralis]
MPGRGERRIAHFSSRIVLLMAWQATAPDWKKPNSVAGPHRSNMAARWHPPVSRWPDESYQTGIRKLSDEQTAGVNNAPARAKANTGLYPNAIRSAKHKYWTISIH